MRNSKHYIPKLGKGVLYLFFLLITTVVGLEILYRSYVIDFYKNQFEALNIPQIKESQRENQSILIFGDSFSADPNSYVKTLRDSLPNYTIYNSSISGSTIKEAYLMADKRITQTRPNLIIYQIYIGNDLFEFRHPTSSKSISGLRKIYWWLQDRIWVFGFMNRQLPYLRQVLLKDLPTGYDPKDYESFSPDSYSMRSKIYCAADPTYLVNTISLEGAQKLYFESYLHLMEKLFSGIDESVTVKIVVVPHCTQVNQLYLERFDRLGCVTNVSMQADIYPFFLELQRTMDDYSNVEVVNLLPLLKKYDRIEPVFFDNDPHLNQSGHREVGNYIVSLIR